MRDGEKQFAIGDAVRVIKKHGNKVGEVHRGFIVGLTTMGANVYNPSKGSEIFDSGPEYAEFFPFTSKEGCSIVPWLDPKFKKMTKNQALESVGFKGK